jgi:DNA modification methylase
MRRKVTAGWAKIVVGDSRSLREVESGTVDLVVTSPPYWYIKDYGVAGQIGYGQSLHAYLKDLYRVWVETYRALKSGTRLCINIGDQFARSITYGRYKIIPLHAEVIAQCEMAGFDFMGSIIWQKKTTMNPTGGATVMGSFPYPPNGIVEIDYEYIHIFKKPGKSKRVSKQTKEASRLTKAEWKEYFKGHWYFGGARKIGHEAMFPEELPRRLIKMFSFAGDTVLDPFLGSGTTMKVGLELGRNVIGYEVNKGFLEVVSAKIGLDAKGRPTSGSTPPEAIPDIEITHRRRKAALRQVAYTPGIQDARPTSGRSPGKWKEVLHKVTGIVGGDALELDGNLSVKLLGVRVKDRPGTMEYLKKSVIGKQVILKPDDSLCGESDVSRNSGCIPAYVYLKNRIFINAHLIKSGLAEPDTSVDHRLRSRFEKLAAESKS